MENDVGTRDMAAMIAGRLFAAPAQQMACAEHLRRLLTECKAPLDSRTLRSLHKKRLVEFTESTDRVQILPPGTEFVMNLIRKKNLHDIT